MTDEPGTIGAGAPPSPEPAKGSDAISRARRIWVRLVLLLATIVTIIGLLAVWANRQVLDANHWADTSTELLQNDAIRTQLSNYLVDQVYANVNVTGTLQSALPQPLKGLAGPVAGGLQDLAQKAAFELLARPRVQAAWRQAMRLSAQQFINIVEGNSKLVKVQGNAVLIDLRPVLVELTQRLGLPSSLTNSIPPNAGQIKVLSSNQIKSVQNGVDLLRGLAIIAPIVALLLFALAVYLAVGRRRRTLFVVGVDLIIAGLVVIIARNVGGHAIVNSLVKADSVKPAVQAAWSIETGMLSDIAQSTIIIGVVVALASSLAGPLRPAVAFRRAAAPWFRERPTVVFAVLLVVLLLIVLWGPIPATRQVIPVLVMIVLALVGTEVLRRQSAQEFPDAQIGDTASRVRGRIRRWRRPGSDQPARPQPPMGGASGPPAIRPESDRLNRLERLAALRQSGALTDREFAAEKERLLQVG